MFKTAYGFDDETIFYFDTMGNKYVSKGGNFAWRINNPGLIRSHNRFAKSNGSIGSYKGFSIFQSPECGHKALFNFLKLKKHYNSTLELIAKIYLPKEPEKFLQQLHSYCSLFSEPFTKDFFSKKICLLTKQQFNALLFVIEKTCGYFYTGNESFTVLPRIYAHFENSDSPHDTYMISDGVMLSKEEVIESILSHHLDAVIVRQKDGSTHIRSRPTYSMWDIHTPGELMPSIDGKIDTISRAVGKKRTGQCIWGFINGVYNSRTDALKSALLISDAANGEQVLSMPNDMIAYDEDLKVCFALKIGVDTPIVHIAVRFFRHLIDLSIKTSFQVPIVVFVHSMGAIIAEHALELLSSVRAKTVAYFYIWWRFIYFFRQVSPRFS